MHISRSGKPAAGMAGSGSLSVEQWRSWERPFSAQPRGSRACRRWSLSDSAVHPGRLECRVSVELQPLTRRRRGRWVRAVVCLAGRGFLFTSPCKDCTGSGATCKNRKNPSFFCNVSFPGYLEGGGSRRADQAECPVCLVGIAPGARGAPHRGLRNALFQILTFTICAARRTAIDHDKIRRVRAVRCVADHRIAPLSGTRLHNPEGRR
jgi:hypothetical protein